jgi:hypothetical protein
MRIDTIQKEHNKMTRHTSACMRLTMDPLPLKLLHKHVLYSRTQTGLSCHSASRIIYGGILFYAMQ